MLAYYFRLGVRQLRRSPILTALIVVTLAVGVAASMSTLTVLYMMSSDPIPSKSHRLFTMTIDNRPAGDTTSTAAWRALSWLDVRNLRELTQGSVRRTGMYGTGGLVESQKVGMKSFVAGGLAVDRDFFAMMDTRFKEGAAWSTDEERAEGRVAVISRQTAEKLFGKESALGQTLRYNSTDFRIVGVLEDFHLLPRFYMIEDGQQGRGRNLTQDDDLFIPLSTAIASEQTVNGSINCSSDSDPGFKGLIASECSFLHFWAEAETVQGRSAYVDAVTAYIQQQKARGRLPQPEGAKVYDVREWLDFTGVVDDDTRLQTWLAFGFLSVCLVNTIGLLLAKFTARAGEIGVRRALGAGRAQIFMQYLVEASTLGLVGSVLGVLLSYGMLYLMGRQSPDLQALAKMDTLMLATTVLLSIAAAVIAGVLPTWRATLVVPALQLKSQ